MRVAASLVLFHPDLEELSVPLAVLSSWSHGPLLVHVNDARDDSVALALRVLLRCAVVTWSTENHGFAGGHNRLLARAFADGADAVVVHNPDLVLESGAVEALAAASSKAGSPCLLGPVLELAHSPSYRGEGRVDSLGMTWTRSSSAKAATVTVNSAVLSSTRRSSSALARCKSFSAVLRAAISRSNSPGVRIVKMLGTTRTRAMTVTHDTMAVNSLRSPASR